MNTILNRSVLMLLLAVAASPCFGMRSIAFVSKERAKELGIRVRATAAGPEAAWVELEFKPAGELKAFSHVELEINEGAKLLVGYAGLRERRLGSGNVVITFMANRAYLEKITLCVVVGLDAGYELRLKDFIELEKIR